MALISEKPVIWGRQQEEGNGGGGRDTHTHIHLLIAVYHCFLPFLLTFYPPKQARIKPAVG